MDQNDFDAWRRWSSSQSSPHSSRGYEYSGREETNEQYDYSQSYGRKAESPPYYPPQYQQRSWHYDGSSELYEQPSWQRTQSYYTYGERYELPRRMDTEYTFSPPSHQYDAPPSYHYEESLPSYHQEQSHTDDSYEPRPYGPDADTVDAHDDPIKDMKETIKSMNSSIAKLLEIFHIPLAEVSTVSEPAKGMTSGQEEVDTSVQLSASEDIQTSSALLHGSEPDDDALEHSCPVVAEEYRHIHMHHEEALEYGEMTSAEADAGEELFTSPEMTDDIALQPETVEDPRDTDETVEGESAEMHTCLPIEESVVGEELLTSPHSSSEILLPMPSGACDDEISSFEESPFSWMDRGVRMIPPSPRALLSALLGPRSYHEAKVEQRGYVATSTESSIHIFYAGGRALPMHYRRPLKPNRHDFASSAIQFEIP